jgi:hypothetical protein
MENPDRVSRSQDRLARSPAFQYMNGNISPYLCFCIVLTTLTNLCFIGFSALTFDEKRAISDEYARRVYIHNYTCMRIHIYIYIYISTFMSIRDIYILWKIVECFTRFIAHSFEAVSYITYLVIFFLLVVSVSLVL